MIFEKINWARVQPELVWQELGAVAGIVLINDAAGIQAKCVVNLRFSSPTPDVEILEGTIHQELKRNAAPRVDFKMVLSTDTGMHLTKLSVTAHERDNDHAEMSVTLASAAIIAHWLVQELAFVLRGGWLLQLEIGQDNMSDRVACKLYDELTMASEFIAISLDDCACCLPPASPVI